MEDIDRGMAMSDDPSEFLWVVVSEGDDAAQDGASQPSRTAKGSGMLDNAVERLAAARQIRVAELEHKMNQFLLVVGRLFRQAEQQAQLTATKSEGKTSSLKLDEVEMSIEITASGEVKLIAGGKAETKGSIKLKFKRVDG
jgi:hypothetical protein